MCLKENGEESVLDRGNVIQNIEEWFVKIALIVGGILVFIIPPMASPDENDHLCNAYAFSDASFFPETQGNSSGRMLPNCIVDFIKTYNTRFAGQLDQQYNFSEAYANWAIASDFEAYRFKEYWNSQLNLIAYLPSGIGIAFYRILAAVFPFICLSAYNVLMMGRICNLLFYVLIIYYALKWTPVMKGTIFLVSVFPMNIFLASTLSYDTMIIVFTLLLFSRLMNILVSEREISWKDIFVISICACILLNVKTAYAPLLIILFSVGITRFGGVRRYIKCVIFVIAAGLIPFIIFYVGKSIALRDFTWKYTEAMNEQTRVIISAPLQFAEFIVNSFAQYGKFYYLGGLGSLGQQDTNIPEVFLYIFTFIVLFVALVEVSSQNVITFKFKILSLIGIFLTIYAIFAGTYIIWTATRYEIGLDYVEGCQGRYFTPLLIWVAGLFANSKLINKEKVRNLVLKLSIGSGIFISIITVICVFVRFWIPVS